MNAAAFNQPAFRKKLFELYNKVNKSIYGFGTTESRIYFNDNMITFTVRHNRVPCLVALEDEHTLLKDWVDVSLMKVFKERFRDSLIREFDLTPKAILRDYDPDSLIAITIIVLPDGE